MLSVYAPKNERCPEQRQPPAAQEPSGLANQGSSAGHPAGLIVHRTAGAAPAGRLGRPTARFDASAVPLGRRWELSGLTELLLALPWLWWSVNCTNGPAELVGRASLCDDLRRGSCGAAFVR